MIINNVREYKETLRQGQFAWPGGYQCFLVTRYGDTLCYACGRKEFRNIVLAIRHKDDASWHVVGADVNWEDNDLFCDNCNTKIPASYGED